MYSFILFLYLAFIFDLVNTWQSFVKLKHKIQTKQIILLAMYFFYAFHIYLIIFS